MTEPWDGEKTPILLHPAKRIALLTRGQALFNDESFFEAHEVWEELWKLEQGRDRDFVQALILVAAHFVHLRKGNWSGAGAVGMNARQKFVVPASQRVYRELDILPLVSAVDYNLGVLSKHRLAPQSSRLEREPGSVSEAFVIPKLLEK